MPDGTEICARIHCQIARLPRFTTLCDSDFIRQITFLNGIYFHYEEGQYTNHPCLAHWEKQDAETCAICRPKEIEVTNLLHSTFRFCCLKVNDSNERNSLEKKIIGSLSLLPEEHCEYCQVSDGWLGKLTKSQNNKVEKSGLWLSKHTGGREVMSENDLIRLGLLIDELFVIFLRKECRVPPLIQMKRLWTRSMNPTYNNLGPCGAERGHKPRLLG